MDHRKKYVLSNVAGVMMLKAVTAAQQVVKKGTIKRDESTPRFMIAAVAQPFQ